MLRFRKELLRVFFAGGVLAGFLAIGSAQSIPIQIDSLSTGLRPFGVDAQGNAGFGFAAVANSGEDSVSIFRYNYTSLKHELETTIRGIPSPNGVSFCYSGTITVLLTSPSDNSVSVIQRDNAGRLVLRGRIKVGPQPLAPACSFDAMLSRIVGFVSNLGDNSMTVIDLDSLAVMATIPDVPAARSLRGVGIGGDTVWVAGTDANVVTLISARTYQILARIPVARPTAVRAGGVGVLVASALENRIIRFDSLEIISTISNIPGPLDVTYEGRLGVFAIGGAANSLIRVTGPDNIRGPYTDVSFIPAITGGASLARFGFTLSYTYGSTTYDFVFVTLPESNQLLIISEAPPMPRQFSVSNAASFVNTGATAGALASLFTAPFFTGATQNFYAAAWPLPFSLGGVSLRIGGSLTFETNRWVYSPVGSQEAPLIFVGPTQVNFQVPPGVAPGDSVPAELRRPDGSSLLTAFRIVPTAPGIFTVLMNGQGQAAALNQDYSQNGNPQTILGARPAARGSVIQIFATGAGETDPPLLPGEAASITGNPLVLTRVQPTVTIGGETARVVFSGMAPGWVGLWQINAEIPANVAPGSAVPLSITADGVQSNTVTIAVE